MAGRITELTLNIDPDAAIVLMCVILLLSSLLGGMKAVTLVAGAQAIVILFGMVAPSLMFSIQEYGLPIPQLTYGDAITDTARLAGAPLGTMASALLPVSALDGFNLFAITLCVGAGVVSLPHVLARSGTTSSVAQARIAAGWGLVVVAVVAATAPAIAAFAKLAILTEVIGVEVADLPQWVFDYAASGLVEFCGTAATTVAAISTACGATAVVNGLGPGDLSIATDAVALGFADITGQPYVLTVLIATAALAAALGAGGAVLIALATSLAHDVYGTLINRRAPHGRRLIVSRLALIVFVAIGAWLATSYSDDMFALAFAAPSLAAAGFFPAIVLGIWWRRTTFSGALSGMAAGFGVTAVYVWMLHIGAMGPLAILGLTEAGISGAASAILGVPLGFVVIVVVSLMTPAPSEARLGVIDAIRRPSPDPILEDHAV
jgi:cation/acetate symporter